MVIEDNEQKLYLVTYILEKHGYRVISAPNGRQGVTLARAEQPDLILPDIQLPEMDGFAVARELCRNHGLSAVPILAVTSYAMAGDRERITAAGCLGYLEKPINPETFIETVNAYL